MTEAMPGIIARNFIYRKVWRLIKVKDMNAVFLFLGDVGRGKSTGAMRWGQDLDKDFSVSRMCFSANEFFTVLDEGDSKGKLKRGSVLVFDEASGSEDAMDSRQSLTHTNKVLSWFSTISRAKGLIIIYNSPFMSQLDKRIRMIGLTGICNFKGINHEEKRSIADFFWSYGASMANKTLTPRPVLKDNEIDRLIKIPYIRIPMPAPELVKNYKQKKKEFIDSKIKDWRGQLIERKKNKASRKVNLAHYYKKALKMGVDELKAKGTISIALIRCKLGLSEKHAKHLKTALLAGGNSKA